MKKSSVVIWALALFVVTIPLIAGAATPAAPHYGSGVQCITCHATTPQGPGKISNVPGFVATSPVIYNNVCQNCHRPGDALAGAKPLATTDASQVFGGQGTSKMQTSHRWDGSDTNPAAGAEPPIQASMTSGTLHQGTATGAPNLRGRTGNQLACVRCHNLHMNPNPNGNALRMANDQDQMCMDCHRSRDQRSHTSGTHPVNVNYNSAKVAAPGSFNTTPQNANPANPTSDLSAKLTSTGNIVCSTCHGVHYTDSRSSTFDGASSAKGRYNYANLSTGDGYILRTDKKGAPVASGQPDKLNICTNCHTGKMNHNAKGQNIQCADCHGAHVDFDPTNSTALNPQNLKNVYLIQRNPTTPGASKIYFRYTGSQREYKNANNTGVCQSCHAVPLGAAYPGHNSNNANDCNSCHSHGALKGAFSPSCDGCHGNPPTINTLGGPNGLATPATGALGTTYSNTAVGAGAHAKHATLHNMQCSTCHNGYLNRPMPTTTIDMGFAVNPANVPDFKGASVSGSYNNNRALLNSYTFTGPVGSGASTCSAVYCHGATLTPGSNPNPSWTGNASQVACGTCHETAGDFLTMGSHVAHAGSSLQMTCNQCHPATTDISNNTSHMQGSVQWDLSRIGASAQYKPAGTGTVYANIGETNLVAPSSTYGTCNNIVCHGQATNILWGSTLYSTTETCAKCHSSELSVTTNGTFYSTATPQVTANTDAKVGTHASHIRGTDSISSAMSCNACHGTVDAVNAANHMNGTTNLVWGALAATNGLIPSNPTYSNGTCSNYCHGGSMPRGDITGSNRNPSWSDPTYLSSALTPAACGTCHGFPPSTNVVGSAHFGMTTPTGFPTTSCGCHPNINSLGTTYANIFVDKSLHINGNFEEPAGGTCDSCHGYPPANKKFVPSSGNWQFAKMENYTGGGGAHTVVGHVKSTANPSELWANCSQCHNPVDHKMTPITFNPSSNIKVRLDSRIRFANTVQAKYSSNKRDGAQHVPGKCSSVACHFQKTPKW